MGAVNTILNVAVVGGIGYAVYKLLPTFKGVFDTFDAGLTTVNRGGTFATNRLQEAFTPETSAFNPYNYFKADTVKENDIGKTTWTSWSSMTLDQARKLGVEQQYINYLSTGDHTKSAISPQTQVINLPKVSSTQRTFGTKFTEQVRSIPTLSDSKARELASSGKTIGELSASGYSMKEISKIGSYQ